MNDKEREEFELDLAAEYAVEAFFEQASKAEIREYEGQRTQTLPIKERR
jgi:hypothetical protein